MPPHAQALRRWTRSARVFTSCGYSWVAIRLLVEVARDDESGEGPLREIWMRKADVTLSRAERRPYVSEIVRLLSSSSRMRARLNRGGCDQYEETASQSSGCADSVCDVHGFDPFGSPRAGGPEVSVFRSKRMKGDTPVR